MANMDLLLQKFDNEIFAQTLSKYHPYTYPFVEITAFGPDLQHGDGEGKPIEWGGRRAWYDEHAALIRRHQEHDRASSVGALSDSWLSWDFERWEPCQGELSSSVTVDVDGAELPGLPLLPVIVDVEISDDVRDKASFI